MVRLREIPRTAAFAWSPDTDAPWLATGTKSGAVDVDFSNETCLELWDLALDNKRQGQELTPAATINTDTGFHDLAWTPAEGRERGIIAGALDSGSLGLWDAASILEGASSAPISSEKVHTGAIKTLQFNPRIANIVATGGVKGELFVSDLNQTGSPIRLGSTAARADDIECLDWNKKVSNILVTGSSGGFVTVWDMRTKKESLTLNNNGRKPAKAIAWDPQKPTRLITAVPLEQDPIILVWDLRNSNAPEKVLRGHDSGVLSLSWCPQDPDLLLSSGMDNRTILWNPQTGTAYGDYPVVTNWTFQTRFNPHNPNFFATASFDGKIQVQTLQNTNPSSEKASEQGEAADGEDFFSKAPTQPQASSFSLDKAPKWLERPCSVSFGFGGRFITVRPTDANSRASTVNIGKFEVDSSVGSATETFEKAIGNGDLTSLCSERIASAKTDEERADWNVIQTLVSKNPRAELVKYLGFEDSKEDNGASVVQTPAALATEGDDEKAIVNGVSGGKGHKRFQSMWANTADGDFLSELAATKGTKTNNPFQIFTGSESEADRKITRSLILGQFEQALDVCLKEDRISDAFMIAVCGGEKCIKKAQEAYFAKQNDAPNYLRLLASVVGKNLWDTVHNADLANWKEVMATLCTFANEKEFPDLCEALGDRFDEQISTDPTARKDASFCYLAGSKLEKVISIWIQELKEHEESSSANADATSAYSVHARGLQELIEKVTIFRTVVNFQDLELSKAEDWKLDTLYGKYLEYADVVAASGQLAVAQKYLDLLPAKYPGADIARTRIQQATKKQPAAPVNAATQSAGLSTPSKARQSTRPGYAPPQDMFSQPAPPAAATPYASQTPMSYAPPTQPANPYAPPTAASSAPSNPYAPAQQTRAPPTAPPQFGMPQPGGIAPPPRQFNQSPAIPPPSQAKNMAAWNDVPEDFAKPTSRRGTPLNAAQPPVPSPFGQAPQPGGIPPPIAPPISQRGKSPLPPPPKAGSGPPPRVTSPLTQPQQSFDRPPSASNPYAPPPSSNTPPVGQNITSPPVGRVSSPYNAPPSAAPPSNRYAPAPGSQSTPQAPAPGTRPNIAPPPQGSSFSSPPPQANPYSAAPPPPQSRPNQYGPGSQQPSAALPPAPQQQFSAGPPPTQQFSSGPPAGGPPQQGTERPNTATSQKASAPPARKYPKGDRSHISAAAQPIVDILSVEMSRVEARAPAQFKPQVTDARKRLDILFDHLNNEDLLKPDTVQQIVELAQALQAKDYNRAQEIQLDVHQNKVEESGLWMVGIKRLIGMSRATP